MHQLRTDPTVHSRDPACEIASRRRAARGVAARTGARDPAARGAVRWAPTPPARGVTGTRAWLGSAAAVACGPCCFAAARRGLVVALWQCRWRIVAVGG
jgi:hypothetical protein